MAGTFVDIGNTGINPSLAQDVLYGLDGNDNLTSSEPAMYAEGGRGHDYMGMISTTGVVELYGGQGNDQLFGRQGALDKLFGGDGDDWMNAAAANLNPDGSITPQETSGVDYMEGGSGSDGLYGFDGNDELYGGGGDDKGTINVAQVTTYQNGTLLSIRAGVYGGDGDDYVNGGGGSDEVYGGAGDDNLVGSYGDDLIQGDAGKDNLYGGSDADRFRFFSVDELNGDRIGDFDRKENDIIDIAAIDSKPGGGDNGFKYIGDDDFSAKGQISFDNRKLKFNTDNDKGAEAVMFVNTDKLSKGDFDL